MGILFFLNKWGSVLGDQGLTVYGEQSEGYEGGGAQGGILADRNGQIDPKSGPSFWLEKMRLASSQLHQLSSSTEGEFLAIGEHLQGFYQRAHEITGIVSGLVSQLGGERSVAAMSGLTEILDTLEAALDHAVQGGGQHSLEAILEGLDQVTQPLTGFGQMNKMLEMFGMYTKIESAHLGSRAVGFQSLALEVTKLSGEVSSKAETVLLRKEGLAAVIQEALATVVSMGVEQRVEILSTLEKTRQSLNLLTSIVDRCSSSAATISASAQEVTDDLGEVVVSLQAHDTVRQQIEHVAETFDELAARLPERGSLPDSGAGADVHAVVEVGTLCQIQAEQLRHAANEIVNAVESIITHLRDIAVKETTMAKGTSELVGVTDQAGTSFFTEMGSDLEAVISTLTATVSTNHQLSEVMTSAAETVGGIFRFVDDIETIAYDIKLIALNFLIQASALGNEGSGLGVLAEAISRLSEEARVQAEGVTRILTEIRAVTAGMCQEASAGSASLETRVSEMRQGVEEMLASLGEMSGGMGQGLSRATAMTQELSTDIDTITAGISVHHQMAALLAEAVTTLDAIIGEARALVPEDEWSQAAERLRAVECRYTMHSERHIHAAVVNAEAGGAAGQQPAVGPGPGVVLPPVAGNDDLGDNVELF